MHTLPSLAQLVANILAADDTYLSGVDLLEHLHNGHLVELTEPVELNEKPTTLQHALLDVAEVGVFRGNFFEKSTAERLLAFDPLSFQRRLPDGNLWLWEQLHGWADVADRARLGFGAMADGFMATAIASLPGELLTGTSAEEAFGSALRLGFRETTKQFVQSPSDWLRRNNRGGLWLKNADGAWAWNEALANGVDPRGVGRKGEPLWRELLPRSSSTPPVRGSLRAGIEDWVKARLVAGDIDALMSDYRKKIAMARCFNFSGRDSWIELSQEERLNYLRSLPAESAGWVHDGAPFWAKGLRLKSTKPFAFVQTLARNPAWAAQLQPMGELVVWLFSAGTDKAPKLPTSGGPGGALEAWETIEPNFTDLLAHALNTKPAELAALISHQALDATTPGAPGRKRGARL